MTPKQRNEELEKRLIDYTVRILNVAEQLPGTYAGQHFAKQIIRSGSSPALHFGEARGAESRKDYRHKLSILVKEVRETHINLRIICRKQYIPEHLLEEIIDESNQIISIFTATIRTLDKNDKTAKRA